MIIEMIWKEIQYNKQLETKLYLNININNRSLDKSESISLKIFFHRKTQFSVYRLFRSFLTTEMFFCYYTYIDKYNFRQ
jgi:hypothetical protein